MLIYIYIKQRNFYQLKTAFLQFRRLNRFLSYMFGVQTQMRQLLTCRQYLDQQYLVFVLLSQSLMTQQICTIGNREHTFLSKSEMFACVLALQSLTSLKDFLQTLISSSQVPLFRIAFLSVKQKWFPCGLPIMSVERWLSVLTQVKQHCKQDCVQRRATEERGATLKPDDGTSPLSAPASSCWLQTAPSQTLRPGASCPPSYRGGNGCWFGSWLVVDSPCGCTTRIPEIMKMKKNFKSHLQYSEQNIDNITNN